MKISDVIADMILDMFDDNKSTVQIQRIGALVLLDQKQSFSPWWQTA